MDHLRLHLPHHHRCALYHGLIDANLHHGSSNLRVLDIHHGVLITHHWVHVLHHWRRRWHPRIPHCLHHRHLLHHWDIASSKGHESCPHGLWGVSLEVLSNGPALLDRLNLLLQLCPLFLSARLTQSSIPCSDESLRSRDWVHRIIVADEAHLRLLVSSCGQAVDRETLVQDCPHRESNE